MTADEIVTKLEPWLARHRRPAWRPVVEPGDGPPTAPKFCGTPWCGTDAPWPDCGHCRRPLQPFLQLDPADLPAELGRPLGTGLLQLFYCTRPDCGGGDGWRPFADTLSRVRAVHPDGPPKAAPAGGAFPRKRIVGWTRFTDLPSPAEHEGLGLKYTSDPATGVYRVECPALGLAVGDAGNEWGQLAEGIASAAPGDKLGGWPAWVQDAEYPACPRCERRMAFVFQLDSGDNVPFMFGDSGRGHVTQCPEHKEVVAFGWAGS